MTLAQITEVWTPLSILVALVSGHVVGLVLVGRYVADPAYASGVATPLMYATVIGIMTVAAGLVFYGGQILTSYVGGDLEWTRVVSRFGIWCLYGTAIAVGTWLRVRLHLDTKRTHVHERAVAELADPALPLEEDR